MRKILTIIGARPQFIKCSPVSKAIRKIFKEIIIHTGQHYDKNMSDLFFKELNIPEPALNLEVGAGTHAEQTGKMLMKLEKLLIQNQPDLVLVYGDTNSTIAGALAAAKLHFPIAHVEAGLRSFNQKMPEEINRKVTDVLSSLLFCPTELAVNNLRVEGITQDVFLTGDVMFDAFLQNLTIAEKNNKILKKLSLKQGDYSLVTIHRAENTDNDKNLKHIMNALSDSKEKIVFPLHPRTKKNLEDFDINIANNVQIIKPVGYLDMLILEKNARIIITDSGGVQKEAYFLKIPCITLRDETEWKETIDSGANILVGTNPEKISNAIKNPEIGNFSDFFYGRGDASTKIVEHISKFLN